MKIINFLNRKGGVGKTVIAANIAYELAREGNKTLLIDLDSQCDLTELLLEPKIVSKSAKKKLNVRNVLENFCSIKKAHIKVANNLYLLPGSSDLDKFNLKFSQKALKDKLNSKELKKFDYIIIDNPPSLTSAVECGLVAADYVFVITEAENPAINNLCKLVEDIEDIRMKLNPNLKILGIVLNKIDRRRALTKRNIDILKNLYQDQIFENYISIDTGIPNSIQQKILIRNLTWRSRTVSQIQNLIKEMILRIDAKEKKHEQI